MSKIAKTYHALQRRSDKAWIHVPNFNDAKIISEPDIVRQLSTARSHRIRVMMTNPEYGPIDIVKVVVSTIPEDVVDEDERIQSRINQLISANGLWKNTQEKHYAKLMLLNLEEILQNPKYLDMQYFACQQHEHDANDTSMLSKQEMHSLADFVMKENVWLIKAERDLIALKLTPNFVPDFVYDFNTNTVVQTRK